MAGPLIDETEVLVVGSGTAGVAAAVSIKDGVSSGMVDIKNVQQTLKKQDVRLF